jgi:hypothetical protein
MDIARERMETQVLNAEGTPDLSEQGVGFLVQNPADITSNVVASVEKPTTEHVPGEEMVSGCKTDAGALYVGSVDRIHHPPHVELDNVARTERKALDMQFQAMKKEHSCSNTIVRDADNMFQTDAAMEKVHDTFQTYNAHGGQHKVDASIKSAIDTNDNNVIRNIQKYAGGPSLLPKEYECPTPGTDWLARMKEEDERMKRAIQQNDESLT